MSKAWSGDWKKRVHNRVQRLEQPSVWALFRAHPGIPFGQIFRFLRETETDDDIPIAYVQLESLYFEEAVQMDVLQDAVADTLVRRLRQHLRHGWNSGKRANERRADVISQWELPPEHFNKLFPIIQQIWAEISALNPPDDWCPSDTNDPIIKSVFDRVWPIVEQFDEP